MHRAGIVRQEYAAGGSHLDEVAQRSRRPRSCAHRRRAPLPRTSPSRRPIRTLPRTRRYPPPIAPPIPRTAPAAIVSPNHMPRPGSRRPPAVSPRASRTVFHLFHEVPGCHRGESPGPPESVRSTRRAAAVRDSRSARAPGFLPLSGPQSHRVSKKLRPSRA